MQIKQLYTSMINSKQIEVQILNAFVDNNKDGNPVEI
jgi:hypothetical protein